MDRILDHDPDTGITSYWIYDEGTDSAIIRKAQDVSGVVEKNKAIFNEDHGRWGDWTRVASIPLTIYYDLKRRGVTDDPKKLKAWLNDPENRFFRTRPGIV